MKKITIINPKTGKSFVRNCELVDKIDNNGNQYTIALPKRGKAAVCGRDESGERIWTLT